MRLIKRIRRETEQEQKLQTDVKQEPFTEEEVVTTYCGVPGFSMDIEKVIYIKAISGTKRLPERLVFEMEDGKRQILPVQIILTLDYRTLVCVYNRIQNDQVLGRPGSCICPTEDLQHHKRKGPNRRSPHKNDSAPILQR